MDKEPKVNLERVWGGQKPKVNLERVWGGQRAKTLKVDKRQNSPDGNPAKEKSAKDYGDPCSERDICQSGKQPHRQPPIENNSNQENKWN